MFTKRQSPRYSEGGAYRGSDIGTSNGQIGEKGDWGILGEPVDISGRFTESRIAGVSAPHGSPGQGMLGGEDNITFRVPPNPSSVSVGVECILSANSGENWPPHTT